MIGSIRMIIDPLLGPADDPQQIVHHGSLRLTRFGEGESEAELVSRAAEFTFKAIYIVETENEQKAEEHVLGKLTSAIAFNEDGTVPLVSIADASEFEPVEPARSRPPPNNSSPESVNVCPFQNLHIHLFEGNFSGVLDKLEFVLPPGIENFTDMEVYAELSIGGAEEAVTENNDVLDIALPVCRLAIQSEAVLERPVDRERLRIAVTEEINLTALGAHGNVEWQIVSGNGQLDVVNGTQAIFTAHDEEETTVIQAVDSGGCVAIITFTVVFNYLVTKNILEQIFTRATDDRLDDLVDAFNESYHRFFLDTCLRRAHFFAQVLTEVGARAIPREESLNYTPEGLRRHFRYFRDHPEEAELFGRTDDHPADEPAIGNRAYANRNGNGDIASGDGFAFRGRGYIQLTGRANYNAIQNELNARFPGSGVDIMGDVDSLTETRAGLLSAMAYWSRNNLHTRADAGATDAAVDDVTNGVNPGTPNPGERRDNFHNTTAVAFNVSACTRAVPPAP